jgi:hypothetical protein
MHPTAGFPYGLHHDNALRAPFSGQCGKAISKDNVAEISSAAVSQG